MEINNIDFKKVAVDDISKLFHTVWNNQNLENIISKTNWAFYSGRSKMVLLADDDKLIASRGAFEWPLKFNDNSISAYQFHGTCVHPDYRRKGLFTSVNRQFLKEAVVAQKDIIFNVSVANSRAGYEKLGWNYIKGFHRLTFINKPFSIISRKLKKDKVIQVQNTEHENYISKFITVIPEEYLESRRIHFKDILSTEYTRDFLQWRLENPAENYKIFSGDRCILVYKIKVINGCKELIIGDFFLLKHNYKFFKKCLNEVIKSEKPSITYTYIFNTHPYFKYYLRSFFLPNPFNFNLHFGSRTLNAASEKFLKNKKWGLGFLDIDTF